MSWFAADDTWWDRHRVKLLTIGPLDEDDARMDLRYCESQARLWIKSRGKAGLRWPGRGELGKRWGWTRADGAVDDWRVRRLLAADDWHDPEQPIALQDLQATTRRATRHAAPTPTAGEPDTPTESPPGGHRVATGSPPSEAQANADYQPNSTELPPGGHRVATGSAPSRALFSPGPPVHRSTEREAPVPGADSLWAHWRTWHRLAPAESPARDRRLLQAALELHPPQGLVDVITWAHTGRDAMARWIRQHQMTTVAFLFDPSRVLNHLERAQASMPNDSGADTVVAYENLDVEERRRVDPIVAAEVDEALTFLGEDVADDVATDLLTTVRRDVIARVIHRRRAKEAWFVWGFTRHRPTEKTG